jgi:tellurite resistance protein
MITTWENAISWARLAAGGSAVGAADAERIAASMREAAEAASSGDAPASVRSQERAPKDKLQALFDAAYMIAAVGDDGAAEGRARIGAALTALFEGDAQEVGVVQRLELSRAFVKEHGGVAMSEAIARAIAEPQERADVLLIVSAFATLGGGVGPKESMALQAIARAFGVPLTDLQKLLSVGKGHLSEHPPAAS